MHPRLSAVLSRMLIDRHGGHRKDVLHALLERVEMEGQGRPQLDALRRGRLAGLLNHARDHVPRFRNHPALSARVSESDAMEALGRLPRMARSDIQGDLPSFLSDAIRPVADDATGGSSGTPMVFKVDRATQIARESSLMWANSLAGWRPGEKIAMLWGSDRDFRGALRSFRLEARWRIENVRWFNAFDMGDDRMEEFDRALTRFRPFLLVAYAGSAQRFARFLADRGRRPSYPNGAIVASAEMLTPAMREDIQAVFGRPVYDRYGNREMGALAAECCAHDGLHINESDAIVEIDSQDPYRVPGPILVTYLHNFCMPFIRYDTGDLGVLRTADACPCGRTTARLAAVVGRQSDTIRTATGNLVHGEFFTHLLYGADGVREFQFVQETLTHYTLRLVADRARTAQHEDRWRREMLSVLGGDVALRIDYVDSIPVLPSGKRKFTLSLVQGELHQR